MEIHHENSPPHANASLSFGIEAWADPGSHLDGQQPVRAGLAEQFAPYTFGIELAAEPTPTRSQTDLTPISKSFGVGVA
ncbi:hypothetical protein ACN4EK_09300 [Pantanalinema rosaneae CENA516]|uniref:hypothetical protein n=1 Tax=Pantanalinema rosaneae TaxID=1620701 RepID=UPI003D6DCFDE